MQIKAKTQHTGTRLGDDHIQGTTCDVFLAVFFTCELSLEDGSNSGLPSNRGGVARPAAGDARPLDEADELAEERDELEELDEDDLAGDE